MAAPGAMLPPIIIRARGRDAFLGAIVVFRCFDAALDFASGSETLLFSWRFFSFSTLLLRASIRLITFPGFGASDARIRWPACFSLSIPTSASSYRSTNSLGLKWPLIRWMITFAFGLVHGFAFSFALREQLQDAYDEWLDD